MEKTEPSMSQLNYKKQLSETYRSLHYFFDDTSYTNQESFELFEGFGYVSSAISRAISDGLNPFEMTFGEFFNNPSPVAKEYLLILERLKNDHILKTELSSIQVGYFIHLASDLMSAQIDDYWDKVRTLTLGSLPNKSDGSSVIEN